MLPQHPVVCLIASQSDAVHPGLLSGADANCLAVLDIANRVGLGVLQGNQRDQQIHASLFRQILVLRDDILQLRLVQLEEVMALLKDYTKDFSPLLKLGNIIGVNLHHIVVALFLGLEDGQRLLGITGGNDAVRNLSLQIGGGGSITHIRERGPVAIGAEAISAPGPNVSASNRSQFLIRFYEIDLLLHIAERQAHSGAGGRNMLKRGGGRQAGGLLQLLDQLPAVQGVHKVDIARASVQDRNRQITSIRHIEFGRLLVGVAAILQFQFFHVPKTSSIVLVNDDIFGITVGKINIANKQGHLVLLIEALPQLAGKVSHRLAVQSHQFRFSLKGRQRISVSHIGVDEMSGPCYRMVILKEIAAAAVGISVETLQDGELIAAIRQHHAGNAPCSSPDTRGV